MRFLAVPSARASLYPPESLELSHDLLPSLELEERSPPTPSLSLLRIVDPIHDPLIVMRVVLGS